jgi:hypothetical protein
VNGRLSGYSQHHHRTRRWARRDIIDTRGEPVFYARFIRRGTECSAQRLRSIPEFHENFEAPVIPTVRTMPERNSNATTTIRTQLTSGRSNNALGRIANPRRYPIAIHNPDGVSRINTPIVWRQCRWLTWPQIEVKLNTRFP